MNEHSNAGPSLVGDTIPSNPKRNLAPNLKMPVRALLQCLIMRLPRNMLIVKKCSKKMQFQVPNVISNVLAEGKLPNPSATTEFLKIFEVVIFPQL